MSERNHAVNNFGISPHFRREHHDAAEIASPLGNIPAAAASLLNLQWLLNQPVIDLEAVATCIRADSGILLHVLSAVVPETAEFEDDLLRVENCIIHLGVATVRAILRQVPVSANEHELRERTFS